MMHQVLNSIDVSLNNNVYEHILLIWKVNPVQDNQRNDETNS